tara:strand:- start:3783 stop:4031 length:249 start_codon:yes stop_codon:yes gene_type:complete
MIPKFILKKVIIPLIEKIFFEMFDQQAKVYKFKKTLGYVELPNEADLGVEKLINEMSMVKEGLKDLEKVKAELDKLKNIRRL